MAEPKIRLAQPVSERVLAEARAALEAAERVFATYGLDPDRVKDALRHAQVDRYRKTATYRRYEELLEDLERDRLALDEAKERYQRSHSGDSGQGGSLPRSARGPMIQA